MNPEFVYDITIRYNPKFSSEEKVIVDKKVYKDYDLLWMMMYEHEEEMLNANRGNEKMERECSERINMMKRLLTGFEISFNCIRQDDDNHDF
jgi:hypothetical protein